MRDDLKFAAALVLTAALAFAVGWQGHRQGERGPIGGEKVDLPRIERLIERGVLADHPADYSAPLESR